MNSQMRGITKEYGRGFNPYYNYHQRYGQYRPQIYMDGYATPWISGCSVGDAKLKLNTPINPDGTLTLYAAILMHFTFQTFWTKKELMEERLGFKPVAHDRWVPDAKAQYGFRKSEKPGYHYSFGSYFTILGHCGLIQWNAKEKVWTPGDRFDEYFRNVIIVEAEKRGWNAYDLWEAFDAKVEAQKSKNK